MTAHPYRGNPAAPSDLDMSITQALRFIGAVHDGCWTLNAKDCNNIAEYIERLESEATAAKLAFEGLKVTLDGPELHDFFAAVVKEAAHQRARWGTAHDAGKTAADWFWLVGYLAGKCLHSVVAGNRDKALHHAITTAAALANWHAAIAGTDTSMRPGIAPPPGDES